MPSNSCSMGTRSPSASTTATEAAKGRRVRTVSEPSWMWAPSTECGSWKVPDATRSSTCRSTGFRARPGRPPGGGGGGGGGGRGGARGGGGGGGVGGGGCRGCRCRRGGGRGRRRRGRCRARRGRCLRRGRGRRCLRRGRG